MRDDGMLAPSGPDELFRQYYGYIRKIVASTPAIPAQDAEDVAMEIMTRLVERDVVGMFNPDMRFAHGGQDIPARFRTFLVAQVQLYVKGQRDKLGRRRQREMLIVDAPLGDDDGEGQASWADVFGGAEDDLSAIDAAEWVRQARGFLAIVPKRSAQDACDLVQVFDALVDQVAVHGTATAAVAAARLGVSPRVMARWVTWMRQNLRQQAALSRRVTIGGEVYTAAHVRQAAALLRDVMETKHQPMVKQPLMAAKNPLWRMDYHRVARAERVAFGIKVEPRDHHNPAPHVLAAVVHHLDRIVAPVLSAPA